MNQKSIVITAAMVLLVGAAAVAFIKNQSPGDETSSKEGEVPSRQSQGASNAFTPSASSKATAGRSEREIRDEGLVEQYGEARTNLSRHVVDNVTLLLDDAIGMGELMVNGQGGAFGRGDWASRAVTRQAGVELNDEQKDQLKEIYKEFQKRELEKSKEAVATLKKNPSTLMGLFLASDARSSGELSEEEYNSLQQSSSSELKDIINPLDRNNFRGGEPLEDPAFRSEFEAMLDQEQLQTLEQKMADQSQESAEDPKPGRDITNIPVMDLESLDKAISSAQTMTSGFKQVMEGMGGLGPLMEQQRKQAEQQE